MTHLEHPPTQPEDHPAVQFWARVVYYECLGGHWPDVETPQEGAEWMSGFYGIPAARFWRWGLFDDRDCVLPPPRLATKIAITIGMPLPELRGFYDEGKIPIPPKLRLVRTGEMEGQSELASVDDPRER